jgi:hypothetical protein
MSKYEPLSLFLERNDSARLTLSFDKIEEVLGFSLPRSASNHPAWWANNPEGHSHSRAWIDAGWRTENLNLTARKVDFVRTSANPSGAAPKLAPDPFGVLAGTVTIRDLEALTAPSGASWDAEDDAR